MQALHFRPWTGLSLAALVAVAGCLGVKADRAADDPAASDVDSLRIRRGPFVERVLLTGELEATRGVRITPPRTPTWQVQIRWMEEDGANVIAGQKVVELDNSAFATDIESKHLDARKEEKQLQQKRAEADARAAELGFAVAERCTELAKAELEADVPPELIPLRDYQEKQLAVERARTALAKAEQELATHARTTEQELEILRIQLQTTRYEIRVAEKAISELVLEATRDGVLIVGDVRRENRKLQVGDTVWPGYVVARIPDLSEMQVVAQLSDVDDGHVDVGDEAIVRLDAYPELTFPGVVRDITPVAQETNERSLRRAFRVRVALEHTDPEKMRPGMAAQVDIHVERLADALLVSRAAVDVSTSPPTVSLASGELVPVDIGPCNSFECVCLTESDGLDEGTRLLPRAGR